MQGDQSDAVAQRNLAVAHQRMGLILAAMGAAADAAAEFRRCLALPAPQGLVNPRNTWPADVHADCSNRLSGAASR